MASQRVRHLVAAWGVVCGVAACAQPAAPQPEAAPPASIESLIGSATCSADAQCRSIGVGTRPCGGPDAYLAWSTAVTDERALNDAVQRAATAQRDANAASGRVSICSLLADPGAVCVQKESTSRKACVLRSEPGRGR